MKKSLTFAPLALALGLAVSSASAMYWPDTPSPTSTAARVIESGSLKHVGMIAFVSDQSAAGKAFEQAYFGHGSQAVSAATDGLYVQIVAPDDLPGVAPVGSVVALSADGREVLATMQTPPDLRSLTAFANEVRTRLLDRALLHAALPTTAPQ